MILLIDGYPIFDHLMKVMGVQDSMKMIVNVYNLLLDSHYQPSTSERDAIHLFIKFFYSRLQHTKCTKPSQGMQFVIRTKVVSRFLDFGKSSTYGFDKQSTDCMFKTS